MLQKRFGCNLNALSLHILWSAFLFIECQNNYRLQPQIAGNQTYSYSYRYGSGVQYPHHYQGFDSNGRPGHSESYRFTSQPISHDNYHHNQPNQPSNAYQSPYQSTPGSYPLSAYDTQIYWSGHNYTEQAVYASYLTGGAYEYYSTQCLNYYGQRPQISMAELDSAFEYAKQQIGYYGERYGNYSGYSGHASPLELKEKEAILMEYVTEYFAKFKCFSKYQATIFLPTVRIGQQYASTQYGDTSCYSNYDKPGYRLECPQYDSKYRSIDGSCNNRHHPYWGKSFVCHVRFLPPDYSDGIREPRMADSGQELPSVRHISNVLAIDRPFDSFYTHLKMTFGQLLNHDITNTPVFGSTNTGDYSGGELNCCANPKPSQCLPIYIDTSSNDYLYSHYNNTCMNFIRSAPCPLCDLGPRQQMNSQTSFADLSSIYGATQSEADALRTMQYGLLKTSADIHGKPLLPGTDSRSACSAHYSGAQCFLTGDNRVNQHPALITMHTIFVRRHNQNADALRRVNPHWNDELLFEESRRITIAEFQLIAYREYMPLVFGPRLMNYYNLNVGHYGYTTYEPYADPTTWNEFSTAISRYGHSQISGLFSVYNVVNGSYDHSNSFWLKDHFENTKHLWNGQMDGIVRGLTTDYAKTVDTFFSNDVRNYLLKKPGEKFGSDLIARNILRGREHGISAYVHYLRFCFGYEVNSWKDFERFIPTDVIQILSELYQSWLDVDLYVGAIAELHYPDANVGPTAACISGIQFYHLKFGDRYYFEHGGQSGSFTIAQLDNIRNTTSMARLLCRTGDGLHEMQRHAFFPHSQYNPKIACSHYQDLNYDLWRGQPLK